MQNYRKVFDREFFWTAVKNSVTVTLARDGRLVLVWGVTKDGQRYDLTDAATGGLHVLELRR